MSKTNQFLWMILILIILLPSTLGRLLIDLAGGLFFLLLLTPIILGGLGWLGWKIIQSRVMQCNACGFTSLNNAMQCPICGSEMSRISKAESTRSETMQAKDATIDISAEESD